MHTPPQTPQTPLSPPPSLTSSIFGIRKGTSLSVGKTQHHSDQNSHSISGNATCSPHDKDYIHSHGHDQNVRRRLWQHCRGRGVADVVPGGGGDVPPPSWEWMATFGAKFILEVLGGAGAIWGFSEAIGWRNDTNWWFWRPASLSVGLVFWGRWVAQLYTAIRSHRRRWRRHANHQHQPPPPQQQQQQRDSPSHSSQQQQHRYDYDPDHDHDPDYDPEGDQEGEELVRTVSFAKGSPSCQHQQDEDDDVLNDLELQETSENTSLTGIGFGVAVAVEFHTPPRNSHRRAITS